MSDKADERGRAPVSPPQVSAEKPRRKPPNRGKSGGRAKGKMVWLTEAENAALEARAAASGLSVASYLRAAALGILRLVGEECIDLGRERGALRQRNVHGRLEELEPEDW